MYKDLFISYSSKDEEFVRKIVELLKKRNISYWFAPEALTGGKKHDEEIIPAIKNCKIFIIFLSKFSRPYLDPMSKESTEASIWVKSELLSALDHKPYMLPIKLDYTVDLEHTNLAFRSLPNYFDASNPNSEEPLVEYIELLLNNKTYEQHEKYISQKELELKLAKIKEIESHLKKGEHIIANELIQKYETALSAEFKDELTLLNVIIKMMHNNIKNLHQNDIDVIAGILSALEESKYRNVVLFLYGMIAFSYYEFNGIRNYKTPSFNQLKAQAKKLEKIKAKYFLMSQHIKNVESHQAFQLRWLS